MTALTVVAFIKLLIIFGLFFACPPRVLFAAARVDVAVKWSQRLRREARARLPRSHRRRRRSVSGRYSKVLASARLRQSELGTN